jgi:hypothetical protein
MRPEERARAAQVATASGQVVTHELSDLVLDRHQPILAALPLPHVQEHPVDTIMYVVNIEADYLGSAQASAE